MYIERHAEGTIRKMARSFGAVLVTGARQVGKTTLLRHAAPDAAFVSLDDPVLLAAARGEGGAFLMDHPAPAFIDEAQYAPALFPRIKMSLDRSGLKGQYFLSGSQHFHMMKDVSESLAGRVGILTLPGLTLREQFGAASCGPFFPDEMESRAPTEASWEDVWRAVHRGRMPELTATVDMDWQMFWGSYVRTYIERDVRALAQVGDEGKFLRFMIGAAARTGGLLNLADLAREAGVSAPTAERWLSILVASNVVCLLRPYFNNVVKRMVKTPRLYFLDTGLAAFLTRWNTPETLRRGAMAEAFFESFVVAEILSGFWNAGVLEPPLWFWRDRDGREIDLLIERDGILFPLEIKKHADPRQSDTDAFPALDAAGVRRGPGGVVCLYDEPVVLRGQDRVIPVRYL